MPLRVICDCDNTMPLPGMPVDDGQTLLYQVLSAAWSRVATVAPL